jgi:opacity protein-like surface antigen
MLTVFGGDMKLLTTTVFAVMTLSSAAIAQEGIGDDRWTGFYAGAIGGIATGEFHDDLTMKGFEAGVLGGYRAQYGDFVYGAEADIVASSMKWTSADDGSEGINYIGSFRAVLGRPMGRFMPFVTAGLAVAEGDSLVRFNLLHWEFADRATHWGPQLGGGAEFALTDNISARAEYRYTALANATYEYGPFNGVVDAGIHSVRSSLIVQF